MCVHLLLTEWRGLTISSLLSFRQNKVQQRLAKPADSPCLQNRIGENLSERRSERENEKMGDGRKDCFFFFSFEKVNNVIVDLISKF